MVLGIGRDMLYLDIIKMRVRFELKSVTKFYPKGSATPAAGEAELQAAAVLAGIDLKIFDNKINAVIGKSGCGKSTLARVLMGLEEYDSGDILFHGKKIKTIPWRDFRKQNQIMFQNPILSVNPCFKVKKIIAEPLVIEKRDKKQIQEKIDHLLDILEIPKNLLDRYSQELSAGQLQRIVFARTLALEPEFIVLDEPFSALDEIMAARLIKHFKKVFTRLNIGVLYISHNLKRVEFLADTVAQMEKGKITKHCSVGDFFNNRF